MYIIIKTIRIDRSQEGYLDVTPWLRPRSM